MRKTSTIRSELVCFECGNIMPISRKNRRQRTKYHIKDIFCFKCDVVTKHIELGNVDIVKKELEFKENRNEEEELIYNLLQEKTNIEEEQKQKIKVKLLKKEER